MSTVRCAVGIVSDGYSRLQLQSVGAANYRGGRAAAEAMLTAGLSVFLRSDWR
jgi:hypothetical protein